MDHKGSVEWPAQPQMPTLFIFRDRWDESNLCIHFHVLILEQRYSPLPTFGLLYFLKEHTQISRVELERKKGLVLN